MYDEDEMTVVTLPETTGEVMIWNEYLRSEDAPDAGESAGHYGMHYGGRQSRHELEAREHVYLPIPYTAWGDYCGGTVERANFEALVQDFEDFVVQVGHGSHDGQSLYLKVGTSVPTELLSIIDGLADYPLYHDEALSEVEQAVEESDLDSWIVDDVRREIEAREDWDDAEEHGFTDEAIREAYYALRSVDMVRWEAETATSGYVPDFDSAVDEIFQEVLRKRALEVAGLLAGHPTLY